MRVEATCSAANQCGGCALQFLDPAHHAVLKSGWVRDAFLPFMDADTAWHAIEEDIKFGQRRRARWWRGHDSEGVFLGFRAKNSHTVIRAPDCQIVHPEIDALRLYIQNDIPRDVESIQMTRLADGMCVVFEAQAEGIGANVSRASCKTRERRLASPLRPISELEFRSMEPPCSSFKLENGLEVGLPLIHPEFCKRLSSHLVSSVQGFPFADTMTLWWRTPSTMIPLARPVRTLHDRVPAGDACIQLSVGPDDFIQGNVTGNTGMVRQVQEWAGTPRFVADLFCGVGNLSLPLAHATGAQVRGGDASASSIRQANASAKVYGLNTCYTSMNLFKPCDLSNFSGADVLILDPPRKGAKRICRNMGSLLPTRIIMVNCDIASGARDAAELHKLGYRLRALRAFDLFPYSGHVEAMSLWQR